MEKEFVTYEQALALAKLKYNGNYDYVFDIYKSLWSGSVRADGKEFIAAPLKQQVFRWFREKYELNHIIIKAKSWFCLINGVNHQQQFTAYEEAENACIDKLIEIVKQQNNGI